MFSPIMLAALWLSILGGNTVAEDAPTWDSLAEHSTPQWFQDAKFGIFIHWGVYSVPAFCDTSTYSEWYQYWYNTNSHGGKVRDFHHRWYGEDFEYREFAPMFRAEFFDPDEWAKVFQRSGAKYMVITSKHHDGFCLWPSVIASEVRGYPWDSMVTGPKRDLLGELFESCRKFGVRPGLYYSFLEWNSPLYPKDIPTYVDQVMFPQIRDLITRYQPDVFWPDGEWDYPDETWRSTEILDWIYRHAENPETITVNDRWGKGLRGQVGDYSTTEYGSLGNSSGKGMRDNRPFEECRGIGHSFAFNRAEGYDIYSSRKECVQMLIDLVSKGGNLLLDIGPTADGRIPLIMVDRLLAMGRWLEIHGESIYGTTRGVLPPTGWGRSTTKGNYLYLHIFDWPTDDRLVISGLGTPITGATFLGDRVTDRSLEVSTDDSEVSISLKGLHPSDLVSVVKLAFDSPPEFDHSIRPTADGSLIAPALRAMINGGMLRLETHTDPAGESRPNLGYWSDTISTATWDFAMESGKRYRLEMETAVATEAAGGTLEVRLGDQLRTFAVTDSTGGWNRFEWRTYGDWTVEEIEDSVPLQLRAADPGPVALMNIRTVRWVPVD